MNEYPEGFYWWSASFTDREYGQWLFNRHLIEALARQNELFTGPVDKEQER